ncbi:SpoU rRNA Methylase family protein [Ekhidna lutea]|uniref:SpoU rRNA Methylase family protein n=1 Tax=Ekhidna lutea TaxID=447679 RepID=A0A239F844_EKHLU|nr:RNA methyltransferase [Ekhidna lutea]SNS52921.1 SpoU rRNA Methylase family protein [Ekhidna lutea]
MRKIKNEELNRLSPEEFKEAEKIPAVLVLDDVRSAMNVGSAFRTSDAFRLEKIYLCGITAQPPHREINKTALGAQDSVEWEHKETIIECIDDLKKGGYQIVAVEQADESTSLLDFQVESDAKYAFVFGNEVFGVNDTVVEIADTVLEIPQYGTKHSLNISVSIGVVLWDFVSKYKK